MLRNNNPNSSNINKGMIRITFCLLCPLLMLTGCSAYENYRLVKNTLLDPTALNIEVTRHKNHYERTSSNKGSLYVMWSATLITAKQDFSGIYVYVNGRKESAVKRGTYTAIEISSGSYELSVGDSDNIKSTQSINIIENQDLYFRTGLQSNLISPNSLFLSSVENEKTARSIISKSRYVTFDKQ